MKIFKIANDNASILQDRLKNGFKIEEGFQFFDPERNESGMVATSV